MAPSASARRRTRWIQGSIIATSAVVIIWATANIAGRATQPTGQTTPPVVTTALVIVTTTPEFGQPDAPADLPTTAEPPVPVVAPATVEAPPTTTAPAQPVLVTYENCAAVWAAIDGPIHRGDPGYSFDLDRDRDGTGCENKP